MPRQGSPAAHCRYLRRAIPVDRAGKSRRSHWRVPDRCNHDRAAFGNGLFRVWRRLRL
jgi:hypothetical protein